MNKVALNKDIIVDITASPEVGSLTDSAIQQ